MWSMILLMSRLPRGHSCLHSINHVILTYLLILNSMACKSNMMCFYVRCVVQCRGGMSGCRADVLV